MKGLGVSEGDGGEDRRGLVCDTPGICLPTERGVTSAMLMNSGGREWTEDVFTRVAGEREELIPPRVPGDEFSSSTSSAMDTPWRIGVVEERRGDDGERSSSERPPGVW